MRIGAHAAFSLRRQFSKFGSQTSVFIKQFFRFVTPQPCFEHPQVLWIFHGWGAWNLMSGKRSLDCFPINELWYGAALRRAENNHGPLLASDKITLTRELLNCSN